MNINFSNTLPPNGIYDRDREKWGVEFETGAIFTYGDTIYCKFELPEDLIAHEKTHVKQQLEYDGGPNAWWRRYFRDDEFRLDQEVKAYRRQYSWAKSNLNRDEVFRILKHSAKSLSGPMYGNLIGFQEAIDLIKGL